jgi:thiazole synthase
MNPPQRFTRPHSRQSSALGYTKKQFIKFKPGLGAEVVGGWWYPEDGQVDNRALAQALWIAAQELGVTLKEGVAAEAIQQQNRRVTGVRTSAGDFRAQHYVLATGAWSNELLPLPVHPKKGQMLSVSSPLVAGGITSGTGMVRKSTSCRVGMEEL